jgi:hypothetical protein
MAMNKRTWTWWSWVFFGLTLTYCEAAYYFPFPMVKNAWLVVFVLVLSVLAHYERRIRALENKRNAGNERPAGI